jgi:dephospho-CoA kinase
MEVIGFVGPFGSGCTTISDILRKEKKYTRISLESLIRDHFKVEKGRSPKNREELYIFADEQRARQGPDFYAKMALDNFKGGGNVIIDDIRHAAEARYVKLKFPKIIIFGIQAEKAERWNRLKKSYNDDRDAFEKDDKREQGVDVSPLRQSMKACFSKVNVIINNQGGVIADGNPYTEELKSVLLEKIAHYTKHPPSEAKPEVIDVIVRPKKSRWELPAKMTSMIAASAVVGGGIMGAIGYMLAPNSTVTQTVITYSSVGAKIGAAICLAALIVYGAVWRYRKPDTQEDEDSS